ncbi:MAG: hypothetical protein EA377_10610 [Phycisphaerales bacterium]|nr:MAG: hypothetical protein EA377_10610 [Phycisphaerales bacterium]
MGTITSSIGLISGIDTAGLIDQLIQLESQGKFRLQNRIQKLQAQQSALMDVNARLLNLKNVASGFRKNDIFQSMQATSSNPDVLTASVKPKAATGSFSFQVKQTVNTAQILSKGFASASSAPMGLSQLTFDFGQGKLNRDRDLSELNGGNGVDPGKISITDASGAQTNIDLSDAVTLNEVLDRINGNNEINVKAKVDGDRLVIDDLSGGGGSLTIANAAGSTAATDLGIVGSSAGGSIVGSNINNLSGGSSLKSLNDGTGVLVRNNVSDLVIFDRTGTAHNLDFGDIKLPIDNNTALADLNNNDGVTISTDSGNPDVKFVARDGTEFEVNLTGVTTVGELISRVNLETDGHIQLSVTDGNKLTVTDTVGGSGPLQVLGAGTNGAQTAQDLGIFNEEGVEEDSFAGEIIPNTITQAKANSIGDIIDRINEQTGGAVTASLAPDGVSLRITDNTGGASNLRIESTAGNPDLAQQLGIKTEPGGVAQNTVDGDRLIASLGSVMVNQLNGGKGLDGASTMTLTDRAGNSVTVDNLDQYTSLSEIVQAVNDAATAENVNITLGLNASGTALTVKDESGSTAGNLTISGDAAAALGIEGDVAANTVNGSHLNKQFVTSATKLSDLNYGKGISNGTFRITDQNGKSSNVNLNSNNTQTVHDLIQLINSRPIDVVARINDTGDGILLEPDNPGGTNPGGVLKVESVSGSTASDLRLLGSAAGNSGDEAVINGAYRLVVDLNETDSMNQVVEKINAGGVPISASVINTGSGANPFRLNLTSKISGLAGDIVLDTGGVDLGFSTVSKAQDAKVFFGAPGESGGFLMTSSDNTIKDVIKGVDLEIKSTSDKPVTINVGQNSKKVVDEVKKFVSAFNDVIERINEYDFFDVDTEERGLLLGNATTGRVRASLQRLIQQPAQGVDGQFRFLNQVGVRMGEGGKLTFNEDQFLEAYESNPAAVENLFTAFETQTTTSEEIAPGITVQGGTTTKTVLGVAERLDQLLEGLTDNFEGTFKLAEESFNNQIKVAEQRLEAMQSRLDRRRIQLERQFAAMETTLAQLQGQGNALASLSSNVQLAGKNLKLA